jgi:hypothetical protein
MNPLVWRRLEVQSGWVIIVTLPAGIPHGATAGWRERCQTDAVV